MSFQDKLKPLPSQSASTTMPSFQQKLKPLANAPQQEEQDGFFETLVKDPIKTLLAKPAVNIGRVLANAGILGVNAITGGKLDEIARRNTGTGLRENLDRATNEPMKVPLLGITVEPQKTYEEGGLKQIAGDTLKTGAYLYSGGRIPGTIGNFFKRQFAKSAVEGGTIGAISGGAYGAGEEMQNTDSTVGSIAKRSAEDAGIGLLSGALLAGGIPVLGGAVRKLTRESVGLSTGTSGETITRGYEAAKRGGEAGEAFTEALRGRGSEEELVLQARSALDTLVRNRSTAYKTQRALLDTGKRVVDSIEPVIAAFNKQLEDYGVTFTKKGTPDFSRSPGLGRYEKDLTQMSKVLADWGSKEGDFTIIGIDNLKQVLDDFRIGSADSRKFDAFVTNLRNQSKDLIKDKPGYTKLVKDYEESTALIKEIQKGLSLGDKASVDTAFRKLMTSLKTNNEYRRQLVEELDRITQGKLLGGIAGQQLSEALPRGLIKPVGAAAGASAALATGGGALIPILLAALTTSPRLVGELLRLLGLTSGQISKFLKFLKPQMGAIQSRETKPNVIKPKTIAAIKANKSEAKNTALYSPNEAKPTKKERRKALPKDRSIAVNLPQADRSVKGIAGRKKN